MIYKNTIQKTTRVKKRLRTILSKIEEGSLTFHFGGRPVRAKRQDAIRVFSLTKFEDPSDLALRNIILEALLSGERKAIGSGYLGVKMFLEDRLFSFKEGKTRLDEEEFFKTFRSFVGKGLSSRVSEEILRNSSMDVEPVVKISEYSHQTSVRSIPSLLVPGQLSEGFSTKLTSIDSSAIMIVDGVVEKVSEIDCLLQSFSSSKKSLCLLAQGFGPEVVQTLYKNYRSSNLYVFPFTVHFTKEILSQLSGMKNFYTFENYHTVRTLDCNSFDFNRSVFLKEGRLEITGIDSVGRKVLVNFPCHLKNMKGLIEDRVMFSCRFAKELSTTGRYLCEEDKTFYSRKAVLNSIKIFNSLRKNIDSISCTILQE